MSAFTDFTKVILIIAFSVGALAIVAALIGVATSLILRSKQKEERIIQKIKRQIRLWPDVWSVPLVLILFYISPYLLTALDPTAATFDLGVLQIIILVTVAAMVFSSLAFGALRWNFPTLFRFYSRSTFKEQFEKLSAWEKQKLFASYFLGFLLALALIANAVA